MNEGKIASISLLFLIILSCHSISPATAHTQEVIKIGVFAPFTSAGLSYYASSVKQGFELGMIYATTEMGYDSENMTEAGRPYEIHYYDTKGSVVEAANLAINAIELDGIDILVGGVYSGVAGIIADIAEDYEKLYFITSTSDPSLTGSDFNPYTFRLARNDWHDDIADATYAIDNLNYSRFGFLAADYSFGYNGVASLTTTIEHMGGVVISSVYANLFDTDFSAEIDALIAADVVHDIECLFIIWASDYSYLYTDLAAYGLENYMNISSSLPDFISMNLIETGLTPPLTFENTTGSCSYGYGLPENQVNDWLVTQHIARNITPYSDFGFAHRIPDLYTASAFATAQFLVNVTNAIPNLYTHAMIDYLEGGLIIDCPKGETYLRPDDHQGLAEMYIAKAWNDTRSGSETEGYLIPQLVATLNRSIVAPPIESLWNGEPYSPGGFADGTPPDIPSVLINPLTPNDTEAVLVTATVTDINGVDQVILSHSVNGGTIWFNQTMDPDQTDTWIAVIPEQPSGVTVMLKVYANDTYGNWAVTSMYSYSVLQPTSTETSTQTSLTTSTQTSSTTSTSPPPSGTDMTTMVFLVGGVGLVIVVLVVIILKKKE